MPQSQLIQFPILVTTAAIVFACGDSSSSSTPADAPAIASRTFGKTSDSTEVLIHTLRNSNGMSVTLTDWGATITELWVPDREGKPGNVVLGFDNPEQYFSAPFNYGVLGRVANRIAGGKFTLDGKEYQLALNRAPNSLHGGNRGFDKRVWKSSPVRDTGADAIAMEFVYVSPDGEENYPGTLNVTVRYTLTSANELRVDYSALTDRPTPVNLSNHAFFNLAAHGTVLDHVLTLRAAQYTPVDSTRVPTGELAPVAGTALDFTTPQRIGERIEEFRTFANGYDHNFALDSKGDSLALAARVEDPASGRVMEVRTTEPAMQFFTGNRFDGTVTGVGGVLFVQHAGFCLEPQHFPNSINEPRFPSTVLRPGEVFRSTTIYSFSTSPKR